MNTFLWLVILIVPFQLLGVAAYSLLAGSSAEDAHLAGVLVPPFAFCAVCSVLAWRSFRQPTSGWGMGFMDGAGRLFLLIILVVGTTSHLIIGAILSYVLLPYRGHG